MSTKPCGLIVTFSNEPRGTPSWLIDWTVTEESANCVTPAGWPKVPKLKLIGCGPAPKFWTIEKDAAEPEAGVAAGVFTVGMVSPAGAGFGVMLVMLCNVPAGKPAVVPL